MSYDVELVYHRPAPGPDRQEGLLAHWQLADPRLPGVPVEKTLWNVYLPPDARLIDSGGNVEPVVAALTETEKLESALSDLRSLSATYASSRANVQERQRALSNFKQLADTVKGAEFSLRTTGPPSGGALLKQADAASQNAAVNRKQASIRKELDSLSAANEVAQQTQAGQDVGGVTLDQNRTNAYGFREEAVPGDASFVGKTWRDNRAADQKKTDEINVGQLALRAPLPHKEQLTLNDSLAVDLPSSRTATGTVKDSTRAIERRASQAASPRVVASDSQFYNAKPPPVEPPKESLRSVGRISLAVDFPQEGRVYHFEKLQADARLTLWNARPERFAPLGWLAVLLAVLITVRVARWGVKRMAASW